MASTVAFSHALSARAATSVRGSNDKKVHARRATATTASKPRSLVIRNASAKEMRDRISSVGNTKKITDAMKLVAAAKVRKAQDAVIGARPFSESLVKVLFAINSKLAGEDVDVPLTEQRLSELKAQGVEAKLITVGKKGGVYFNRRTEQYNLVKRFDMGQAPSTQDAQTIADEIFAEFTSEEVDKVEMIYSRFVSLISAEPTVQTLLPLSKEGEVCNAEGVCVDAADDEIFKLTSEDGQFSVKREANDTEVSEFEGVMQFEQDPNQILDALMPLYMNSQILRALQESLASELAARMNAMSTASDNAKELKKTLSLVYNRARQAKITSEIIELVAGAAAT